MNARDLTTSTSDDNMATATCSLDYDARKIKDTPGRQTHAKRLLKSENDPHVLPPSKNRKMAQSFNIQMAQSFNIQMAQSFNIAELWKPTQGKSTHETQVSEGGEADLHKHFLGCKKNPGHKKCVPVNDFSINHLPEGYDDNDLVEFVKATADLTVRVAVKMTSTERPRFYPKTRDPYPFYDKRGSEVLRVGTGKVLFFISCKREEQNMETCKCHTCQHSDTPSKFWQQVCISTATHVVFDDLEARYTTCRLFYDRQDSPLVTLDGWKVYHSNVKGDDCWLICVTCDLELINKLRYIYMHWFDLREKILGKYRRLREEDTLAFIVSHPHGCPKQVSVGRWIKRYEVRDDRTWYKYTTCTCPGSRGAHVQQIAFAGRFYQGHAHSGVDSEGTNHSCAGGDYYLYRLAI